MRAAPDATSCAAVSENVLRLDCIAVVGVGLIGGSFALALRAAGVVDTVIGVDRDPANLRQALELGVITAAQSDVAAAASSADLVLIAAPVGQYRALLGQLIGALLPNAIVTDAGSTKQDVVRLASEVCGTALPRFVPGHPIAGAERSGVTAARADLFRDRRVILTPLRETASDAVAVVEALWTACGAAVQRMGAATHDRIFAAVSHLPHLLSFALVEELASRNDADEFFRQAASGFRDFTRIAGSSPEMWRDVVLANREAVLSELETYQAQLSELHRLIENRDGAGLHELFSRARDARNAWAAGQPVTT